MKKFRISEKIFGKISFLAKILKFSSSYNKGEIDTVPLP